MSKPQLPRPAVPVKELEAYFERYASLATGLPLVVALWSIATYLVGVFDAFPYLAVTSPVKRCGKTRLTELLEFICHKATGTVGSSTAALFRLIGLDKPTLIIDEAEYLGRRADERASALREILNSGYRQGRSVKRCEKTTKETKKGETKELYEVKSHDTYCPKVLVLIGKLQETLGDRCIEIRMERRGNSNITRFRFARVREEAEPLRIEVAAWAESQKAAVAEYYQENGLLFLRDREEELFLPLFAVCAIAAPERIGDLEATARRLAGAKESDAQPDYGIRLLSDVRDAFTDRDRIATADLLEVLIAIEDAPWAIWGKGRGLNPSSLAYLLRPFRICPVDIRLGERVQKGYRKDDFKEAWDRYLPERSATPLQTA